MTPTPITVLLWALLSSLALETPEESKRRTTSVTKESIVVTPSGTERALDDEPASIVVLDRVDLLHDPALVLDEALRAVPGFSLFRRQSSTVAHPTTQGVSLRGTGASGAGRALVLRDGIPLNDPFGGWVLWGQVPREAIDQVEILRGGGADLYGSSTIGGVIQLFSRDPMKDTVSSDLSGGTRDTSRTSLFGSVARGPWSADISVATLSTDGWNIRRTEDRGAVDRPAGSDHWLVDLTLRRESDRGKGFLRVSAYDESRRNGTELQVNGTEIVTLSGGMDWLVGESSLSGRAWLSDQELHSTFTAVAEDRNSERLVRDQTVPADAAGLTVRAIRPLRPGHLLLAGAELRFVDAISHETVFLPDRSIALQAGGSQDFAALWIENLVDLTEAVRVTAALRYDGWRNRESQSDEEVREDSFLSPRVSILYRTSERLAWTTSVYRAFRAPTLNELYRGFRVGDVVTEPNRELIAERLTGLEAGLNAGRTDGNWTGRIRGFWMEIDDPIANVTITSTPELLVRQRRNLGSTRSRGIEADVTWFPVRQFRLRTGWLWSDSVITSFPSNREIEGNRIPQVPRVEGTIELRWTGAERTLAVQSHYVGDQLEDDENLYDLPAYLTWDLYFSQALPRGFILFLAGENVTGERWLTGRTPLETIGPPRLLRAGVRWTWESE